MSWYYEHNGAAVGPVAEDQFNQLVAAGTIGAATLVWREGMESWQPHAETRPAPTPMAASSAEAMASDAPMGVLMGACGVCGRAFPMDQLVMIAGARVCAGCKPAQLQALHQGGGIATSGIWRDGKTLVASREATFPDRCICCGASTDLKRVRRHLYWHHPALYLVILVGLLIYVIVALIVRKRAVIEVSVCSADRSRRAFKIAAAWLLWIGFLVAYPVLAANKAPDAYFFFPPLILVAAVAMTLLARLVIVKKIDEHQIWLRGVSESILADLPPWPGK